MEAGVSTMRGQGQKSGWGKRIGRVVQEREGGTGEGKVV
jgi:hypothetical protein